MTDIIRKSEAAPQGYRITNAGLIPNEWAVRPLSSIVEEITETAGSREIETVSISAGIGFVNQAEKFGKELSGKQYEKYTVLHRGDFSYNKGNSNLYPQGCIYRLNDRTEAAVPNVFESFRVSDGNPDYYEQLFISGFLNRQLYSRINRGIRDDGLLNLRGKDFYSCEVPCPPLDEQKRIAKILMQCDKVIELKRKRIEEEKKKKRWLLENTLNSGTPITLRQCCTSDGEYGLNAPACEYCSELPKYIRITDIDENGKYRSNSPVSVRTDEISKYMLCDGDILFVRTGATVGKAYHYSRADGDLVYAGFLIRFSVDRENYDDRFIYYQFQTSRYHNWIVTMSTRSGQPGINANEYGKYQLLIPRTIEEQQRIADILSTADMLIEQLEAELIQWINKKNALMHSLLTGIVRIKV